MATFRFFIVIASLLFPVFPAMALSGAPPKRCMAFIWKDEDSGKLLACLTKHRVRHARREPVKQISRSHAIPAYGREGVSEDIWQAVRKAAIIQQLWLEYNDWLSHQQSVP